MSLSWSAAFAAWHTGLQRERLLSATRHAELVRLLTGGATDAKRQGQLRAAQRSGYFVAQGADGRQQQAEATSAAASFIHAPDASNANAELMS